MTFKLLPMSRPTTTTRRLLVTASVVPALAAALTAPAMAAAPAKVARTTAPAVTEASCVAAGGTYSLSRSTRTCTTVTTRTTDGAAVTASVGLVSTSWPGGSARYTLIGTSYRQTTVETTVKRSQVAGRTPTESRTSRVAASVVVPVDCTERLEQDSSGFYDRTNGNWVAGSSTVTDTAMPVQRCASSGLYTA